MTEDNNYNGINTDTFERVSTDTKSNKAGVYFLLLMLLEIPLAFLVRYIQSMVSAGNQTLVSLLITQGYLLFSAFVFIFVTHTSFTKDLRIRKYKISTFFLSLLVLLCASPMATVLNLLSQFFVKNETSAAIFEVTRNVPFWLAIVIIGCLPGFCEELIYRGIMRTGYRKKSILVGIIVSSLSFGLMHLNFNQMLYAVYLGAVFAFVAEATDSLLSTMLLHMIFNSVSTVYMYALPKLFEMFDNIGALSNGQSFEELLNRTPTNRELLQSLIVFAPMSIVGIVLTVLLIMAIAHINQKELTWEIITEKNDDAGIFDANNVCLAIGWLICFVICIINMGG
ncbi:MAG: CPBP family intramembrane metalloprotease [Lachnospiraceae bacterium]|jgi:hypothetical protein|nr:CPBP family intramembrane metalloprotease [Lachnospiraceae bacterium]